jgi:hypothetical protein
LDKNRFKKKPDGKTSTSKSPTVTKTPTPKNTLKTPGKSTDGKFISSGTKPNEWNKGFQGQPLTKEGTEKALESAGKTQLPKLKVGGPGTAGYAGPGPEALKESNLDAAKRFSQPAGTQPNEWTKGMSTGGAEAGKEIAGEAGKSLAGAGLEKAGEQVGENAIAGTAKVATDAAGKVATTAAGEAVAGQAAGSAVPVVGNIAMAALTAKDVAEAADKIKEAKEQAEKLKDIDNLKKTGLSARQAKAEAEGKLKFQGDNSLKKLWQNHIFPALKWLYISAVIFLLIISWVAGMALGNTMYQAYVTGRSAMLRYAATCNQNLYWSIIAAEAAVKYGPAILKEGDKMIKNLDMALNKSVDWVVSKGWVTNEQLNQIIEFDNNFLKDTINAMTGTAKELQPLQQKKDTELTQTERKEKKKLEEQFKKLYSQFVTQANEFYALIDKCDIAGAGAPNEKGLYKINESIPRTKNAKGDYLRGHALCVVILTTKNNKNAMIGDACEADGLAPTHATAYQGGEGFQVYAQNTVLSSGKEYNKEAAKALVQNLLKNGATEVIGGDNLFPDGSVKGYIHDPQYKQFYYVRVK